MMEDNKMNPNTFFESNKYRNKFKENEKNKEIEEKKKDEKIINKNIDLSFKKIRDRRKFLDFIKDFMDKQKCISSSKLEAYLQYTTGSSLFRIREALVILEDLGFIEYESTSDPFKILYKIPSFETR